jgi:cell division protein FtsB
MRQAFGAFKAGRPAAVRRAGLFCLALLAQSCAILPGADRKELLAKTEEALDGERTARAALEAENEGLRAEKSALETKVADLEKRLTRLAALEPRLPAAPTLQADMLRASEPQPTLPEKPISTAPAAPIVAAPNADVALPGAPVPVDDSPRLVQPTFASAEQTFENEAASPEIRLKSVLWGVHLASYRHEEEAASGWKKLQRQNPDELGLLEPRVERVNIEGKGAYLRLVGGGFSTREKATALCGTLATKGVFCRVTNFGGDRLSMLDAGDLR